MDFDCAKENIQPLAAGRNASMLQASLRVESPQELLAQRSELEQAIHAYVGDDPLEAWYDYITWIEQSYPSGGKESGLDEVLTKCLTCFESETRYYQDRRMIRLYIKFFEMHKDPSEWYQQLFNEGIGTMVADMYICWAYCYDMQGNYRKADEIFRRGIACRAAPFEELQEAHQHFGFTVSQRLMYKDDECATASANRQLQERRLALTTLRTHRRKVGSVRTGTAVKQYAPGIVETAATAGAQQRGNAKVQVFHDENDSPNIYSAAEEQLGAAASTASKSDSRKSVVRCIIDAARNQENLKEPGPWNKAHDKKHGKLFGKSGSSSELAFAIMEDDTTLVASPCLEATSEIMPIKLFPNHKCKNRPLPDWPTPVTIEDVAEPRALPRYNKCHLYPRPNMEFQPEELRAYMWYSKRGICNGFTKLRDSVWLTNNIEIALRQYPNFAKRSRPRALNKLDAYYEPPAVPGLCVPFAALYNTALQEEFQAEELLHQRLLSGARKTRYDINDTIHFSTEMEETVCFAAHELEPAQRRKSFFPTRKSMAPSTGAVGRMRTSMLPKPLRMLTQSSAGEELKEEAEDEIMKELKEEETQHTLKEKIMQETKQKAHQEMLNKQLEEQQKKQQQEEQQKKQEMQYKKQQELQQQVEQQKKQQHEKQLKKQQHEEQLKKQQQEEQQEMQQKKNQLMQQEIQQQKKQQELQEENTLRGDAEEAAKTEQLRQHLATINISSESEDTVPITDVVKKGFEIYQEEEEMPNQSRKKSLNKTQEQMQNSQLQKSQEQMQTTQEQTQQQQQQKMPENVTQKPTLAIYEDSFEFKAPAEPNKTPKLHFEIYEEPDKANKTPPQAAAEPKTSSFFELDESCNTQAFNCFLKTQAVSTPNASQKLPTSRIFGNILKERPTAVPAAAADAIESNCSSETSPTATIDAKLAATTTDFSPLFHKQLSTILETSEQCHTKSTFSSAECELDARGMPLRGALEAAVTRSLHATTLQQQTHMETVPEQQTSTIEAPTPVATTPHAARNFHIFEDRTEELPTQHQQSLKHAGNFSRLEQSEDTATGGGGYIVPPIKFQEDKTETITKMMMFSDNTKQPPLRFPEDKTETISHMVFAPPQMATGNFESENTCTISNMPFKAPANMEASSLTDDSFNFFTQTPPKTGGRSHQQQQEQEQQSLFGTAELLDFDIEKTPRATLPKQKCVYDTPELREKMSFLQQQQGGRNASGTAKAQLQPTALRIDDSLLPFDESIVLQTSKLKVVANESAARIKFKDSFMPDFTLIPETQPQREDSFVSDSQPQFSSSSNSKLKQSSTVSATAAAASYRSATKSTLRDSFALPDFSMVMDSQPTEERASIWKQATKDASQKSATSFATAKQLSNKSSTANASLQQQDKSPALVATKPAQSGINTNPGFAYGNDKLSPSNFDVSMKTSGDFFEFNAETAQFAPNMLKNSTMLFQERGSGGSNRSSGTSSAVVAAANKPQSQIQKKSLHIKNEPSSFDTSYQIFKSPPLPAKEAGAIPKHSKLSFLGKTMDGNSNESTRMSIDMSPQEMAALQQFKKQQKQQQNAASTSNNTNTAVAPNSSSSSNRSHRLTSQKSENEATASVSAFASSPTQDDNNDMSIYVLHTPKTPVRQRHIWNVSHEDAENSNEVHRNFIHREADLNQTQQVIAQICQDDNVNPFSTDLNSALLDRVEFTNYLENLPTCELLGRIKPIEKDQTVQINDVKFRVQKMVGEGAYGAVYCAIQMKTGKKYALKQEKPPNYWEYYICLEVQSRLSVDELLPAFMGVDYALFGNNASILASPFAPYGSLIDVCHTIKKVTLRNIDEYVVMHLACQLLEIMDHLHAIEIIHADIKADNFMLMRKLSHDLKTPALTLIDFGVSIDMSRFKKGQTFTYSHKENAIKCVEMREQRPWTYQLDLFGLAGVLHVLLFAKYMDVEKNANGFWMHKTHVPRYLHKTLWETIFKSLLNIRDCASMPNLQKLRALIKEEIAEKEKYVIQKIVEFNRALNS